MRILLLLSLISLLSWTACSDIEREEDQQRLVDDEVIISSMTTFLSSQKLADPSIVFASDLWLDGIEIKDITDICGSAIDTTFALDVNNSELSLDAAGDVNVAFECNNLNLPSAIRILTNSTGSFALPLATGTFEQSSMYEGVFDLINIGLKFSGITGRTGMLFLEKDGVTTNLSTSFRFELIELEYNLATQSEISGEGVAIIRYGNEDVSEEYVVRVMYLGDSIVQLRFNDEIYEINLGN